MAAGSTTSTAKGLMMSMLLILLIIVSSNADTVVANSSYRGILSTQKGTDSKQILRELVSEISKIKASGRRVLVGTKREAPEGPDPQHH